MGDPGPGRALLAAATLAVAYTQGGILRTIVGAVLIGILLMPGPGGGPSIARGLVTTARGILVGGGQ